MREYHDLNCQGQNENLWAGLTGRISDHHEEVSKDRSPDGDDLYLSNPECTL